MKDTLVLHRVATVCYGSIVLNNSRIAQPNMSLSAQNTEDQLYEAKVSGPEAKGEFSSTAQPLDGHRQYLLKVPVPVGKVAIAPSQCTGGPATSV